MPRAPRRELAGAIHHVTSRGNDRMDVFRDAADRRAFLGILAKVKTRCEWRCITYCLMRNHYHLLVLTERPNLGAGMNRLNGTYAQRFNKRYERTGHLWGARYYAGLVEREAHLLEILRYIALNPVRAGLCSDADHWRWSGHRALAGLEPSAIVDTPTAHAFVATYGGAPLERYRALVASPVSSAAPS